VRVNYEDALAYSNEITSLLFRYCMRIQPTGALRRKEAVVDSIEMIASPQVVGTNSYWTSKGSDLSGEIPGMDRLEAGVSLLVAKGALNRLPDRADFSRIGGSHRPPPYVLSYRRATVVVYRVIAPSDWGIEFLLRTGDDDFLEFLEGKAKQRGFFLHNGRIEKNGKALEAPEESDVLRALGLDWIEPQNRKRDFLALEGLL